MSVTAVLTGIQTKFNATTALTGMFPGGLWLGLSGDGGAFPTCVLNVVSSVPDFNTGSSSLLTVTVQFSVFSLSDTEALAGTDAIKAAFDFTSLNLGSLQCVLVKRNNEQLMREDQKVWHAFVEYAIWVGE